MSEQPQPTANIIDITMKKFDNHMVTADYRIFLQSDKDSVETLIRRLPDIKKEFEV